MVRDHPELTRRRVLAGLSGLGALSAAGGTGTLAAFSDGERFTGRLQAGQVDIHVACADCFGKNGHVGMTFENLEPGDEGVKQVNFSIPRESNPVRLWLRTTCPPVLDTLGGALEARLSFRRNCQNDDRRRIFPLGDGWMPLTQLREALHDGVRLDDANDPCLTAGDTVCLVFEYRLPESATWAVNTETTLRLELFGQQCRHVSETEIDGGPFANADCPTIDCESCVKLGKLDIVGDQLEPATTYRFDELYPPFDGDGSEYTLEPLTITNKVGDGDRETICASFRLLQDGSESDAPPICAVTVGGGQPSGTPPNGERPADKASDGESHPSYPDSRHVRYEVEPPLTRTRGELCAAHDKDNPTSEQDGERPAISNVTILVCSDSTQEVTDDESA